MKQQEEQKINVQEPEKRLQLTGKQWIVQAISDQTGKSLGLTKNLFDVGCILCSVAIGLIFAGRLVGIGIGTLLAVLGVGRAVALFNLLLKNKMLRAAGLEKK